MRKFIIWFIIAGFVVGGVAILLPQDTGELPPKYLVEAQNKLATYKKIGIDTSRGPCLGTLSANQDWVVDVAHNPREAIDDDPQNQCEEYRNGQAKHFIELDPDGQLIRFE